MTLTNKHVQMLNEILRDEDIVSEELRQKEIGDMFDTPETRKVTMTAYQKNFYRAYALYIIGCLATADAFVFSFDEEGVEDIGIAVRIIAACLEQWPDKDNHPELPFEW